MTGSRLFDLRSAMLVIAVVALSYLFRGHVTHDGNLILVAIVAIFGLPVAAAKLERRLPGFGLAMFAATFACGVFLLAVGVDMAVDWVDPLPSNPEASKVHLHGKQLLVLPLISYWPYALILVGGFVSWTTGVIIQQRVRIASPA